MKNRTLILAVAVVAAANLFALAHAWRNRTGTADAELVLTERELSYYDRSAYDDDSGVSLALTWTDFGRGLSYTASWLDRVKLQALGFDCGVDPASPGAQAFYARQRSRQAFAALENDGPAWREWEKATAGNLGETRFSRLMPIDADLDAARLRARHPDRQQVAILPAVIGIGLDSYSKQGQLHPRIFGRIQEIPSSIHVPKPFSDQLRGLAPKSGYRVHLRFGALHEPWVTGLEITPTTTAP